MKVNTDIFKSRDIRGVFPNELDKETAFKIGQAFVRHLGAKTVVVGRDMRLSSPELFDGLVKGIISQGAEVLNIGQVPTECLYFATINLSSDAGIMITASHNPKEYNGFKMFQRKDNNLDFVRGKDLLYLMDKDFQDSLARPGPDLEIREVNIWEDYLEHLFSLADLEKINPLKVVIDAGNGMAGKVIPKISNKLPIKIIDLNFKLDGNFPAHPSNPLQEGAADQIGQEVIKQGADFGFIFDGDADRIYLIDEKGEFISGDITLLLLAKYLLAKHPGMGIAYNLICSKATPIFVEKWGGRPLRTAVGVVELKKALQENNGIMGGELSGHYLFKSNYYMDSGFIAFLILLQIISESNQKVSELIKELSLYFKLAEISFKIKDKEKVIEKVKEKYSDGQQDFLDGITVEYKNWWFNLRPSATEPLLRLTLEADAKDLLEQKRRQLVGFINKNE